MRLSTLTTVLGLMIWHFSLAQSTANYSFDTRSDASLDVTTTGLGISFNLSGNLFPNSTNQFQPVYVSVPEFLFMGKRYNVLTVQNTGVVGLSIDTNVNVASVITNTLLRQFQYPPVTGKGPVIAPFWSSLKTAASGPTVRAVTIGVAPYRCMVVEWNVNINVNSITATSDGVFQLRIYESTGKIEFVYGKMQIGSGSTNVSASVGFSAGSADNTLLALKDLSGFAITRLASEEPATRSLVNSAVPGSIAGLHSTTNGSRRILSFTPPAANGSFTSGSISRVLATSMQLSWADNITNKLGYLLYRSAGDSNNYKFVASLPASASGYTATGLNTNTRYYWKLIAHTEGNTETALRITDSTRCLMSGVYSIGPGGQFSSFQQAKDSLAIWGLAGNTTWEMQPSFSFTAEPLPITLKSPPHCYQNNSTLTVRPAASAVFNVSQADNTPVFLLDSTSNVVIDGRAGGTGAIALTLQGTELVRIRNGWNNELRYLDIRAISSYPVLSPITIESSKGAGSHHNTISSCLLHDHTPVALPDQYIGTVITGNTPLTANSVINSEISNFRGFAVNLEGTGWTISGNSFYSTLNIDNPSDTAGFIRLKTTESSISHQVANNYFGGTAPGAGGGQMTRLVTKAFVGIDCSGKSNISANVFKRINLQTTALGGSVNLMHFGRFGNSMYTPVHHIRQNQFGAEAAGDSICIIKNSPGAHEVNMIYNHSYSDLLADSNNFVNIRTVMPIDGDFPLNIIYSHRGTLTQNTISTKNHAYQVLHRGKGELVGIRANSLVDVISNTVTNMTGFYTTSGIALGGNNLQVKNNEVSYLKTLYGGLSGGLSTVTGITAITGSGEIIGNRIYHLQDSSLSPTLGYSSAILTKMSTQKITGNLIDGLDPAQSFSGHRFLVGIKCIDDASTITNNMVRLGLDSSGMPVIRGTFFGYMGDQNPSNKIYHNSFYLAGGTNIPAGSGSTYGLSLQGSVTLVKNNIVVNDRSYSGGGSSTMLSGSFSGTSDYNLYKLAAGVSFSGSSATLKEWQNNGKELHSIQAEPNFVNPDGPTRTLDLHVTGVSAAESRGTPVSTVTTDFDGESRTANTPVDIGADAGLFVKMDLEPPVLILTPLSDVPDTASRVIEVNILDSLGAVADTGINRPAIWYRKNYPVASPWQIGYGTRISGTAQNGIWRFQINHQLINVSPGGGDSVQYYFAAQDTASPASFVSTSPAAGASHPSVSQQVAPPSAPYHYRIRIPGYIIPPVVTIGPGQRYTSITNDFGLFEGIALDSITGDITARIGAHLLETGKWSLDSLVTIKGIKITIVPSHDSLFVIRNIGNLAVDMIRLQNADNVTIDGSFNGSGRWLRFVNTNTTTNLATPVISLLKSSDQFSLKNCQLMSNSTNSNFGIVLLNQGNATDIEIRNNLFTNAPNDSKPAYGINYGSTATINRIVVAGNEFSNIVNGPVRLSKVQYARVDSNHIYWNSGTNFSNGFKGISITESPTASHLVRYNHIGGSMPFTAGSQWTNSMGSTGQFYGIHVSTDISGSQQTRIESNVIRNIESKRLIAIFSYGGSIVESNIIGDTSTANSLESQDMSYGIYMSNGRHSVNSNVIGGIFHEFVPSIATFCAILANSDSLVHIKDNVIRNITTLSTSTSSSPVTGIRTSCKAVIENNEISNLRAEYAGSLRMQAIDVVSSSGEIHRNRIYGSTAPASTSATIIGIGLNGGSWKIHNNQISLANGNNSNNASIYGIATSNTGSPRADINYNSILVGGSQSTGTASSAAIFMAGSSLLQGFRNNLLFNMRTGGTGIHGLVEVNHASPASLWPASVSNYNLYAGKDSSKAFRWGTSQVLSIAGWRSSTAGDANGYYTPSHILSPGTLFRDSATGNLNIDTTSQLCWYLNGKGNPIAGIDGDFNRAGARSISVSNGPVDIGSHEFNTTAPPPPVYVYGRHLPGGSDTLSFNGKLVAVINWDNTGTLPTLGDIRWYSGVWPNDTTNGGAVTNARYNSSYLSIPATGGSNYSYSLVYFYDSSMLGKVPDPARMALNKKQIGVAGSWQNIPSTVNTAARTVTISNQTSFSEFTGADVRAPLPVRLLNFVAAAVGGDVQLNWQVIPEDESEFVVERSFNGQQFTKIISVMANGGSTYNNTDAGIRKDHPAENLYYRLRIISKNGNITMSRTVLVRPSDNGFVVQLAPNPFDKLINVSIRLLQPAQLTFSISDLQGKTLKVIRRQGSRGVQTVCLDELEALTPGLYVLRVASIHEKQQFVILKAGR